jgi:hypothetical protein
MCNNRCVHRLSRSNQCDEMSASATSSTSTAPVIPPKEEPKKAAKPGPPAKSEPNTKVSTTSVPPLIPKDSANEIAKTTAAAEIHALSQDDSKVYRRSVDRQRSDRHFFQDVGDEFTDPQKLILGEAFRC